MQGGAAGGISPFAIKRFTTLNFASRSFALYPLYQLSAMLCSSPSAPTKKSAGA
jgi:hypothetical protein